MSQAELKNSGKPDEVREFPNGRVELVNIGGALVGRAVFEPGGDGRPRSNRLRKLRVVKLPTYNTTFRAC